jgi:hypothetical protein
VTLEIEAVLGAVQCANRDDSLINDISQDENDTPQGNSPLQCGMTDVLRVVSSDFASNSWFCTLKSKAALRYELSPKE